MTEEGVEEESISWDEEWTVLEDDGSTRRDRAPAVDDAEEALQVSSPLELPLRATPADARDQESDGVSVISESSEEEAAVAERIVPYRSVQRREDAGKEEVAPRFNILVVCCLLLTAIGVAQLGSRMYFETDRPCPGEAYRAPRPTDNERLLERTSREFCRVEQRSSAEEAKSSVVEVDDRIVYPFVQRDETKNERSGLSDRLQILLRTVCLLLGDIRRVCDTRSLFTDLAKLRILLTDAIGQADESMKSENEKFLEKMEHRLASIDDAFVADLTRALDKSSSKNEKRLEKIRDKMKERLCILRNTMEHDSVTGRRRRSPETDDAFLEYCDETRKILTVDRSETKEAPSVRAPDSDNSKRRGDDGYWPNVSEEHREASWRISKDRGEAAKYRRESSTRKKSAGKSEPLPRSKSVKKKTIREREEGKKRKSSLLPGKTDGSLPAVTSSNSGDEYWYDSRRDPAGSRPRRNKSKRKKHETDESNASSDTSDEEQQDIAANGQWQFARSRIRDELRKEEAHENWYFDRVRNRKSARMNLNNLEDRR